MAGLCACPSDVKFIRAAGRRGSLPLQDLIRDLETDGLDLQILSVGAGRGAGPRPTVSDCLMVLLVR